MRLFFRNFFSYFKVPEGLGIRAEKILIVSVGQCIAIMGNAVVSPILWPSMRIVTKVKKKEIQGVFDVIKI